MSSDQLITNPYESWYRANVLFETRGRDEQLQREAHQRHVIRERQAVRRDAQRAAVLVAEEAAAVAATYPDLDPFLTPPLKGIELRWHIHHLVDLAFESEPPVQMVWLKPETKALALIGAGNAVSVTGRGTIAAPAIRSIVDVVKAKHELGHQRRRVRGRLSSEIAAWQYAIEKSLYWDWTQHACMSRCLMTYADGTKNRAEVADLESVEQFVSVEHFNRLARPKRQADIDAFEDRLFKEAHGIHPCVGGHCLDRTAVAVTMDAGRFVCRSCRTVLYTDRLVRAHRLERELRHLESTSDAVMEARVATQLLERARLRGSR